MFRYAVLIPMISTMTLAMAQTPPPQHAQPPEQTEQGQFIVAGKVIAYRIRLLPLSAFPDIPAAVRTTLEQLHCMVPQTYEARRPENVIHGHFYDKSSSDWAMLCSHNGTTSLEFVREHDPGKHFALASHRNLQRLSRTKPGGNESGYDWGIDIAPPSRLAEISSLDSKHFDHDGIEDSILEQSSTIFYYKGSWVSLERAN